MGIYLWCRNCAGRALIINKARNQILHGGAAATIRNVRNFDSDRRVEQQASEMSGRARARRAILHLVLIDSRVSNKFLQVVGGKRLSPDQNDWLFGDEPHWREVSGRIVQRVLIESL